MMIFQSKKQTNRIDINLLNKKEKNFSEKLIFFSLHYLRYVIVLTQTFVIGVFFYRFLIDQQIIDLKEGVEQQEQVVKITIPMVEEAQKINSKTLEVKKLLKAQDNFSQTLNYIFAIIPTKVTIDDFSLDSKKLEFNGKTDDPLSIKAFYERLKKDKKFKNININSITKKEGTFEFSVLINI